MVFFFWPVSLFLVLVLILFIPFLLILFPLKVFETVLKRLGIPGHLVLFLFAASLLGSFINIPIATWPVTEKVSIFKPGLGIFQPLFWGTTPDSEMVLAVNVGGAVVPVLICLLLLPKAPILPTIFSSAISIGVCYSIARPVPGLGITIPTLIPPLVAILCAFLFSPRNRAPVAYISGVTGVLVGADLLHLFDIPVYRGVMSIGGAGVFDGIFLVGIFTALFA